MSHMSLRTVLMGAAVLSAIGALPTPSHALSNGTFAISETNFGFVCPAGSCGTVTVSGDGTTAITVAVAVTAPNLFIHGIEETVAFVVNDTPTVTINAAGTNGTTWSTTLDTTVGQQDGFGNFTDAVNCAGTQTGNRCGTTVSFTLSTASTVLTLGTSTGASGGNLFSIRLGEGLTGGTGFGVVVPGPIVGAGLPGLVFACGGLLALARRRRLQQAV